jgi:hypothetical protein
VTSTLPLPAPARRAFDRLAGDLARVLGDRFLALVATGPASSVAFASALSAGDFEAFGALDETWHHDGLETPLLMTVHEFQRSLDAFPLEFQGLIDRHVVIRGAMPFAGVRIDAGHLRRACEVQAKGHLIHLRQGWIEAAGHQDRLAALIARSAASLRLVLTNVARLADRSSDGATDAAARGAALAGLPASLVASVLAAEHDPALAMPLIAHLPDYLAAAEQLWSFVDGWHA